MVGFWICVIVAIVCAAILCGMYMFCCYDSGIAMFEDKSIYERRLEDLENQVQKLMEGKL